MGYAPLELEILYYITKQYSAVFNNSKLLVGKWWWNGNRQILFFNFFLWEYVKILLCNINHKIYLTLKNNTCD